MKKIEIIPLLLVAALHGSAVLATDEPYGAGSIPFGVRRAAHVIVADQGVGIAPPPAAAPGQLTLRSPRAVVGQALTTIPVRGFVNHEHRAVYFLFPLSQDERNRHYPGRQGEVYRVQVLAAPAGQAGDSVVQAVESYVAAGADRGRLRRWADANLVHADATVSWSAYLTLERLFDVRNDVPAAAAFLASRDVSDVNKARLVQLLHNSILASPPDAAASRQVVSALLARIDDAPLRSQVVMMLRHHALPTPEVVAALERLARTADTQQMAETALRDIRARATPSQPMSAAPAPGTDERLAALEERVQAGETPRLFD